MSQDEDDVRGDGRSEAARELEAFRASRGGNIKQRCQARLQGAVLTNLLPGGRSRGRSRRGPGSSSRGWPGLLGPG